MTWFLDGTKLLVSGNATTGRENKAIWLISTVTGSLRVLRDGAWGAAVSPDGSRIAFKNYDQNEIWIMGPNGENPHKVLSTRPGFMFERLVWSATGQRLAFLHTEKSLEQVMLESCDADGGERRIILSDRRLNDFCWAPDGRIICSLSEPPPNQRDSNLWQLHADPRTGRPSGKPRQITNWAGFAFQDLGLSADGKRLGFLSRRSQSDVLVADLQSGGKRLAPARRLTVDERIDWPGGWARDSRSVFFYSDRNGNMDIFRQGVEESSPESVVADREEKRWPQVSPDGKWLLFLSWPLAEAGKAPAAGRLNRIPLSGGAVETVIDRVAGYPGSAQIPRLRFTLTSRGHPDFRCPPAPAACVLSEPEQNSIVFSAFEPRSGRKTRIASLPAGPADKIAWDLSPDGSRLATVKMDRTAGRIVIFHLPDGAPEEINVNRRTNFDSIAWAADGRSLFVTVFSTRGSTLLHVGMQGEATELRKSTAYMERPLVSPDGHRLAFGESNSNSNAWVIEKF